MKEAEEEGGGERRKAVGEGGIRRGILGISGENGRENLERISGNK